MRISTRKSALIQARTSLRAQALARVLQRKAVLRAGREHHVEPELKDSAFLTKFCQMFVKLYQNFQKFLHPIQHFSAFSKSTNFCKILQNFA